MTRGAKILVFGLIGTGVVVVLACGGLVYFGVQGFKELNKAVASSDAFLNLLNQDKVDEAYAETTAAFKAKVDPKGFRDLIAKYPAFAKQASRSVTGMRMMNMGNGFRGIIQYSIINPNNTLSLTMTLKNEEGRWRVEGMNIP